MPGNCLRPRCATSAWSIHNNKDKVDFTVNLEAIHAPPGTAYRDARLPRLIHSRRGTWSTVETGLPIEPVAEDMLADFRDYGWPAILAAVDLPGFQPDPTTSRATSSPEEDSGFNPSTIYQFSLRSEPLSPFIGGRLAATGAAAGLRLRDGRM
jgi:hypothetical protein